MSSTNTFPRHYIRNRVFEHLTDSTLKSTPKISDDSEYKIIFDYIQSSPQQIKHKDSENFLLSGFEHDNRIFEELRKLQTEITEIKESISVINELVETSLQLALTESNQGGEKSMEDIKQLNNKLDTLSDKVNQMDKTLYNLATSVESKNSLIEERLNNIKENQTLQFKGIEEKLILIQENQNQKLTDIQEDLKELKSNLKESSSKKLTIISIVVSTVSAVAAIAAAIATAATLWK